MLSKWTWLSLIISLHTMRGVQGDIISKWSRDTNSLTDYVYIPSTYTPEFTEITVCFWVKFKDPQYHSDRSISMAFLWSYHHETSTDYLDSSYDLLNENLRFGITANSGSWETLTMPAEKVKLMNGQWRHLCNQWNGAEGKVKIHLHYPEEGESYQTAGGTGFRTVSIPGGTASGAWVPFFEQDAGSPVGAFNDQQAFYGSIASFQIFSTFIPTSFLFITGCGLRADLFDSSYDAFTTVGNGLVESSSAPIEYCNEGQGIKRWRNSERSENNGLFYLLEGYEVQGGTPVSGSTPSASSCSLNCVKTSDCVGFTYFKSTNNCNLLSTDLRQTMKNRTPVIARNSDAVYGTLSNTVKNFDDFVTLITQ